MLTPRQRAENIVSQIVLEYRGESVELRELGDVGKIADFIARQIGEAVAEVTPPLEDGIGPVDPITSDHTAELVERMASAIDMLIDARMDKANSREDAVKALRGCYSVCGP